MLMLNLCCGRKYKPGMVNVDFDDTVKADEYVDLNVFPWPWETDSVDLVVMHDSINLLSPLGREYGQLNKAAVMQEIWRILRPGGKTQIIVQSVEGSGAFADPLAATFWNQRSFLTYHNPKSILRDDMCRS